MLQMHHRFVISREISFNDCEWLSSVFVSLYIQNWKSLYYAITAWKRSVFRIFLIGILPHSDQKNSEYGYFLHSECFA